MGAHFAPMIVAESCCLIEPLNSKKSFLSTNSAILINFSVGNLIVEVFSTQPYEK